jgi:GTPase SAR1 family protein
MSERMRGRLSKAQEVTVVLVGDANVGKTALVTRFCEDIFIQVIRYFLNKYYFQYFFFYHKCGRIVSFSWALKKSVYKYVYAMNESLVLIYCYASSL